MMIVMKMKTRWQTQAAPARKSISYTLLLIYNHGEEIVERLIWGNNQQAKQQQESFTFLYNDSLKKIKKIILCIVRLVVGKFEGIAQVDNW